MILWEPEEFCCRWLWQSQELWEELETQPGLCHWSIHVQSGLNCLSWPLLHVVTSSHMAHGLCTCRGQSFMSTNPMCVFAVCSYMCTYFNPSSTTAVMMVGICLSHRLALTETHSVFRHPSQQPPGNNTMREKKRWRGGVGQRKSLRSGFDLSVHPLSTMPKTWLDATDVSGGGVKGWCGGWNDSCALSVQARHCLKRKREKKRAGEGRKERGQLLIAGVWNCIFCTSLADMPIMWLN